MCYNQLNCILKQRRQKSEFQKNKNCMLFNISFNVGGVQSATTSVCHIP